MYYPDGEPFKTLAEFAEERDALQRVQAETEALLVASRRGEERALAVQERLAVKLRELGVDPDKV